MVISVDADHASSDPEKDENEKTKDICATSGIKRTVLEMFRSGFSFVERILFVFKH